MTIDRRTINDVIVLTVIGDITMTAMQTAPLADTVRSLLHDGHNRLVLDLGRVRYVDSAGLGEIVAAFSATRARGGTLKLLNVTKRLTDLLIVTKLLMVFDCFDLESDALASFRAVPVARALHG